ncbi:MFS transporter [Bhargavaea ullalensis]|uniref:YNFM family putative membrane transporter n=1 Tax=Bhargavaea ullalensis TaxID=1265685 RepID=A0ABV2GEU3_9BACL
MVEQPSDKPYTLRDAAFWKIIGALGFASLFIFSAMYATQPLLPLFTEEFGIGVSVSSLSVSMTTLGLIIGLLVISFLSDRRGRTLFIKSSVVLAVIPFFIMPFVPSFGLLILLRFLQGIALAGVPAAALAYISEEVDRRSASFATALYISTNALGGMTGRFVTGWVTEHYSWQAAFLGIGIAGAVIAVAVLLLLPSSRRFDPAAGTAKEDMQAFLFHLRNPLLLILFGLGIVLQLSFTGVWTFLPFHLGAAPFNLSLEAISYTYFAYGIGVIGSPLAGWLAGKFGLRPVRITGIVIMSSGILLTLGGTTPAVVAGLCVMCLGFFTAHSLTSASVARDAEHHKGSASSLYLVSYYIGVAAGSTLLSPLWTTGGWELLILVIAVLPVVYLIFSLVARKKIRARR